ncbi:MAG: excinuclease ABC subunit UvrC [Anaerolineae bacterium]|jgi:excinuclease ABC subunit C|nr:excinuclease ABC subunit UvrC [Chloroflexota bacterium]
MGDDLISTRLAGLPERPGVYLFKDVRGTVLYVGKAIVLRNRVRSYFHASAGHTPKTERLVAEIADLEWIVTESELEALILENELIKRHQPRYNVRLKDDKRYPYIKISMQEDFPRIYTVRSAQQDGARYFGPFTSSQAVHQTLEVLRRLFPYRTCNRDITGRDARPCLYYHIKLCTGPCIGAIDREGYRNVIDQACLFLEGKSELVIDAMSAQMEQAATALDFERAAVLRDQIASINLIIERQRIVSGHLHDHDIIAFARDNGQACVQVFFIRNGKLIGREYFLLTGTQDEDESAVMGSFIKQFYNEATQIPPDVIVQHDLEEFTVIQSWLRQRRGARVTLQVPKRGEKKALLSMAHENAVETLARLRDEWNADTHRHTEALTQLQEALGLPVPPARIECYDISTLQGKNTVGSMVVFVQGAPSKQDYRRFRIRTITGQDDFASMAEMISRRFARARQSAEDEATSKGDRWAIMPDLIILDGGKGQLSTVREVMEELGVDHIPTVGLAKQEEEIFSPGRSDSIRLPAGSEALFLVQRIRDEAHRFAVTYHRKLRGQDSTRSLLDGIPGIGPRRRLALLKHFGSLEGIRNATLDQLAAVPGMNRSAAEKLREYL